MQIYAGQYLLPITGDPIENGAIAVFGNKIVAVGKSDNLRRQFPDAEVKSFEGCVILPGLINAHTHLDLTLFEPEGKATRFVDWVIEQQSYLSQQAPVSRRAAIVKGIEEAVEAGTTCIGDVGYHDEVIQTIENSRLRFVLFPEVTATAKTAIQDRYETALGFIDSLTGKKERITAGLAPYAPYLLSRNLLKVINQHAFEQKIPLKIHASESFPEMEFFFESKGDIADVLFPHVGWGETLPPPHRKTPIQFLDSIGFLATKPSLIGCIHLANNDLALLAKSGAKVIHCPRSDSLLGLGRAPVRKMVDCGISVALGTDGIGKNGSLSLWDEMRFTLRFHKEKAKEELTPEMLLNMTTINAAKVLGLAGEIGSLEEGKKADFIIVKISSPAKKKEDLCEQLVKKTTPSMVEKVFVDGREVKRT